MEILAPVVTGQAAYFNNLTIVFVLEELKDC